jgi:UDP-N-acetylmuramyl pentapeptide phosphotransferase/UDP-N-acetylglucosamine-1-phosphate transferase
MIGGHYYLIAFALAVIVVWLMTPVINYWGRRAGYVDQPNARKMHHRPMVRLGGISIFFGCVIALVVVWQLGAFGVMLPKAEWEVWGVVLGGLAFFAVGLCDDLFELSPFSRLLIQVAISSVVWSMGVQINFVTLPLLGDLLQLDVFSLPITVIWLVGLANAINWIDGLDGLAAGVCGISAVVLFVLCLFMEQSAAALIAVALAGGALGFLRYNFSPAQIFMGDGGAYFMGFTLGGVAVIGLVKVAAVTTVAVTAVLLPYLVLAVPILDMSVVIFSRLIKGKSPFKADKGHLHHRLINAGISQRLTVLFIYALTLWGGSLALGFSNIPSGWGFALGATCLLLYLGWQVWRDSRKVQE